jgi:hypothetical protein
MYQPGRYLASNVHQIQYHAAIHGIPITTKTSAREA